VTSLVILLIVVFLFKEGIGLFGNPEISKNYALCVHQDNPVSHIGAQQIRKIFDADIDNWDQVGGKNGTIRLFRFDEIFEMFPEGAFGKDFENLPAMLGEVIERDPHIIAYLPRQYLPQDNPTVKVLPTNNLSPAAFFTGQEWMPASTPAPLFGVMPLVTGTLWVSLMAILIALPLGLGVAIYLAELANERIRRWLKPTIELLAGIPSVVYGFFGLVVIVPMLQQVLDLPVGETALAGSLVLAVMALPTIITIAEDALRTTPKAMKEASLGLGATHWQTIHRVVVPFAAPGITAAVVLGIGRAVGETMAVLMVTGNAAVIPHSLLEPVRTIPATIAAELGEAPAGGMHYQALFLLGCVLFILTMVISIAAEVISKRNNKNSGW
jgi:phosphate transport system permease protein